MPRDNKVVRFVTDAIRQGAKSHVDDAYIQGFNAAANVAVDALSEGIDDLLSRITRTGPLSDAEQLLLAHLTRIRADIEGRLRAYDESADDDGPAA